MKRRAFTTALLTACATLLSPSSAAAQLSDAREIAERSHLAQYYAGDSGRAAVEMTIKDKRGRTRKREFVIVRKDAQDGGEQRFFVYFQAPGDVRRMSFLAWKRPHGEDARWIYVPAIDLVRQISARDKFSSFAGSDFNYEDVSGRHWAEDQHVLLREETLEEHAAYVIESRPSEGRKSSYSRKLTWVDQATWLPIKAEYYGKKDELERVFQSKATAEIDGHMTITAQSMTNVKKRSTSTVTFSGIGYDLAVDDDVFTEGRLRTPPRELIGG